VPEEQRELEAHRKWVSASGPPPGLPLCPACRCDSFTILMNVGCSASTSFLLTGSTVRDSAAAVAADNLPRERMVVVNIAARSTRPFRSPDTSRRARAS
jgi:hypothetical protein